MSISNDLNFLFQKALNYHNSGDLKNAESIYRSLIKSIPNNFEVNLYLAILLSQKKDFNEALKIYSKILKINPKSHIAYLNQGLVFQELDRLNDAFNSYEKSNSLLPNVQASCSQGIILSKLNKDKDALAYFEKAIKIDRNYPNLYYNYAKALANAGSINEAVTYYLKSIEHSQNLIDSFYNLGCIYQDLKQFESALHYYQKVIKKDTKHYASLNNIGQINHILRNIPEALKYFDKALEINPNYHLAKWNKALSLILSGKFIEGWELYENRWYLSNFQDKRHQKIDLLKSIKNITGKKILVWWEQGFGDVIQFSRYLLELQKLNAEVTFEVQKPLKSLFESMNKKIKVVDFINSKNGEFNYQIPVMSLPMLFKTDVKNIPNHIPYLFSDTNKKEIWKKNLNSKITKKIGIAWSGAKQNKKLKFRSIPLKIFSEIFNSQYEYHSLQKEYFQNDEELFSKLKNFYTHENKLHDFSDTAALIDNMDIVITIDTSVAHLAGSIGKKVWIIIPYMDDYRWFMDINFSPWYPTAKIFRQKKINEWDEVINEIKKELMKI